MSYVVEKLKVRDFRNYDSFSLELDPFLTVVLGPNAAGKTNLVEALQLLTAGESFKRPSWNEVIREGKQKGRAEISAAERGGLIRLTLDIERDRGRTYFADGVKKTPGREEPIIPGVVFTPDDLAMAKGASEVRRALVDSLGSQMSVKFNFLRREYLRALRQRNALLREGAGGDRLEPWTLQLLAIGVRLINQRLRLVGRIAPKAAVIHTEIAGGERLEIEYVPSWRREAGEGAGLEQLVTEELLREESERAAAQESRRKTTLVGPHRDDIIFKVDGREARAFASQGQQRSIALSWKLAEVAVITDVSGRRPLLLLDDVMSELDEERRSALAERVNTTAQTVVTTTNLHYFGPRSLERASVVRIG